MLILSMLHVCSITIWQILLHHNTSSVEIYVRRLQYTTSRNPPPNRKYMFWLMRCYSVNFKEHPIPQKKVYTEWQCDKLRVVATCNQFRNTFSQQKVCYTLSVVRRCFFSHNRKCVTHFLLVRVFLKLHVATTLSLSHCHSVYILSFGK